MRTKSGPGKTRTIDGKKYRRPSQKFYDHPTAEHVAAGHRGVGRSARIAPTTCPKGKKAYVVYVRGRKN